MVSNSTSLTFSLEPVAQYLAKAVIAVPAPFVDTAYDQASYAKQHSVSIYGFERGQVPVSYIEKNYRSHLLETIQEFLLRYLVSSFLYQEIMHRGLLVACPPRLTDVVLEPHKDASFYFELSLWDPVQLHQWKSFPFKAPKRKNYKDIDRQVQSFIKEEQQRLDHYNQPTAQIGDWIGFDIVLLDQQQKRLLEPHKENLWIRIGDEEADASIRSWLVGRSVGESFYTQDGCFQSYFHHASDTPYIFCITITGIVPYAYVCFDDFKHHFKLQTKKDLHAKLIEVFSFRNDLSQRRTMAEEALKLIVTKHSMRIPNHFSLREQQEVLDAVRVNPDYHVYKTQPQFKDHLKKLADKQIKERLIIDQIAYHEGISINDHDIRCYLNLTKRQRMKGFLYFSPPSSKVMGQEMPLSSTLLGLCCRREKTLNHIIHHLTKNKGL